MKCSINKKIFKVSLFSPLNLNYWWNLGSMLLLIMMVQIITGLFLTFYYENSYEAFSSIWIIHLDILLGSMFHYFHLNLASFLFLFLYLHMMKGIFYYSFITMKLAWVSGWSIFMMTMMTAFLGYVLPWGQMSLWGATVITNLLSAIPKGYILVKWIWGGYFVSIFTMKLFFSMHFLIPFIIMIMAFMHMTILHYYGSSNPLGSFSSLMKEEFSILYLMKDLLNITILIIMIMWSLINPLSLGDPENFNEANPLVSPIHIQPEWYFLQYYAILRAIPSKLGGVVMFILSLMLLLLIVVIKMKTLNLMKIMFFMNMIFIMINLLLIWLGGMPVEYPYLFLSQIFTFLYFLWYMYLLFLFS